MRTLSAKQVTQLLDVSVCSCGSEIDSDYGRDKGTHWNGTPTCHIDLVKFTDILNEYLQSGNLPCRSEESVPMHSQETEEGTDVDADDSMDGRFGLCPVCHKNDGYLNVGNQHWFICEQHKSKWFVGEDLFSSWMFETPEEQSGEQQRVGFESFVQVEAYYPPAESDDMQVECCEAGRENYIWEVNADEADELDTVIPQSIQRQGPC